MDRLEMVCDRILSFLFPNAPQNTEQLDALRKAAAYQIEYEDQQTGGEYIPAGAKSFKIGDFSMSFAGSGSANGTITKRTLAPEAYGVLLRAGLLYRGLERRGEAEE